MLAVVVRSILERHNSQPISVLWFALEAAACADEQGQFWAYHDRLFADPRADRERAIDRVADAIKRLFENKAFKSKEVAASLSGNAVIVKKISLPVMTEGELSESIYWEAEQYIPFDIQDVNLDYQILDAGTGPESRGSMDVLLVAAKKEKIGDYTSVIAQAGRTPVIVDVDAFALQNAYEANYGVDPHAVVVLLNAGASAININIIQGDQSVFTRDVSMGGNACDGVSSPVGVSPSRRGGSGGVYG